VTKASSGVAFESGAGISWGGTPRRQEGASWTVTSEYAFSRQGRITAPAFGFPVHLAPVRGGSLVLGLRYASDYLRRYRPEVLENHIDVI